MLFIDISIRVSITRSGDIGSDFCMLHDYVQGAIKFQLQLAISTRAVIGSNARKKKTSCRINSVIFLFCRRYDCSTGPAPPGVKPMHTIIISPLGERCASATLHFDPSMWKVHRYDGRFDRHTKRNESDTQLYPQCTWTNDRVLVDTQLWLSPFVLRRWSRSRNLSGVSEDCEK
jgi:hypothetical protein